MDPLCEKYYNISPYSYCAGNPIRYVDPDGRDYRLFFDHDNRTITIFANYKVAQDASEVFSIASEYWNSQSFKIGDYTVGFNITDQADENGKYLNTIDITENPDADDKNTSGITKKGNIISLFDEEPAAETVEHEIGHTLGLGHYTDENNGNPIANIMYYNGYNRGTELYQEQVQDILYFGKSSTPNFDYASDGRSKVNLGKCVPPTMFGTNYRKNIRRINKR